MRIRWIGVACVAVCVTLAAPACRGGSGDPAPSSTGAPGAGPPATQAAEGTDALTLPHDLGKAPVPAHNPQSDAKVRLGRQLFFDQRLSVDGKFSCYSCHRNEDGNGGHDSIAVGPKGVSLGVHSPVIWNVGYLPALYWDGRAKSLEDQALLAWGGPNMGVGNDKLAAKTRDLAKIPGYARAFAEAFPGEPISPELVARALAAYERTLVCKDTRYDRYARGNKNALDGEQKRGLDLFLGQASCTACHTPPHFSGAYAAADAGYFNTGIGIQGKAKPDAAPGRKAVTGRDEDWGAFRAPTLRNVSRSAPYFHDGSVATLEDAVRLMARGGFKNENRSPLLEDRGLSPGDIRALVRFLAALDCESSLEAAPLP